METKQDSKNTKQKPAAGSTAPIRVKRETRKKILLELAKANKKDFGRKLRAEDLIAFALTLIRPEHVAQLQETTLSNADRLEQQYREFVAKHGSISKDAYLGKLLGSALPSKEVTQEQAPQRV